MWPHTHTHCEHKCVMLVPFAMARLSHNDYRRIVVSTIQRHAMRYVWGPTYSHSPSGSIPWGCLPDRWPTHQHSTCKRQTQIYKTRSRIDTRPGAKYWRNARAAPGRYLRRHASTVAEPKAQRRRKVCNAKLATINWKIFSATVRSSTARVIRQARLHTVLRN